MAIFVEGQGWRFTILYGLAFGLESAVVAFNRFPLLGIAAARRCTSAMTSAYFDDELSLEFIRNSDVSHKGLHCIFKAFGAPPQLPKGFSPAADRHYLGTSIHVGEAESTGSIRCQPKLATTCKVVARLDDILQKQHMSRDDAGKLRGELTWLFTACTGPGARYAAPLLRRCQAEEPVTLAVEDLRTLRALQVMVSSALPRDIPIVGSPPPFFRIYTDASFEQGALRLGWVLFPPNGGQPFGGTCLVPCAVVEAWKENTQQIYPGETLCVLLLPILYGDALADQDALWFIDNQSAVSSAIYGASKELDVHEISFVSAILRIRLDMKTFFEWIDSTSNPSDGLSRHGLACEWSQRQDWVLQEIAFPITATRPYLQSFMREM